MNRAAPELADVHHTSVCYSKSRYCGHPRQCPIYNYGNGEIVVVHHHAPSAYQTPNDIKHGQFGYKGRAKILLQRSLDHGMTWPQENDVVVWDDSRPLEEKRAILWQADKPGADRAQIALADPDAAIYFARPASGPEDADGRSTLECFAFRSGDRGWTWENIPTRVSPPRGLDYVHVDGYPLVKFSDSTQLTAATIGRGEGVSESAVAIYGTDDDGLTWEYLAQVAHDPTGRGRPTYANLLMLPSGRLQCYMLNIGGVRNVLQMAYSDDGGYSWSEPTPIVAWGQSPWVGRHGQRAWSGARRQGVHYRSPWPLRLHDGRIVVLFARRKPPFGMGLIVSENDGACWSAEAVIRADASDWDLGYPVATQLDNGRIFTAYYYVKDDGNGFGGTRYIAGSFFRLP
jgi:hypothetical protein